MSGPYTFCFSFDFNYLTRGLALYESLVKHCRQRFTVWMLCLDDRSYRLVEQLRLPSVRLLSLAELEATFPDLAAIKTTRSAIEYFWTCKPSLLQYVLDNDATATRITLLDADLYFYGDPAPVFEEMASGSVTIVNHKFPPAMARRAKRGIYNVGFLSFKRDDTGLSAVRWWRERCVEWCFARVEPTRYAEQKYLDDWPARFNNVVVLAHNGAGLAPWNWMNYRIEQVNGSLVVDNEPLVFYHFASLRMINQWWYDTGLSMWQPMPAHLRRQIYRPYLRAIRQAWQRARTVDTGAVLMDRVSRNRAGLRAFWESLRDGQIGWV